jgi:rhodanese-related sulfurtransferase
VTRRSIHERLEEARRSLERVGPQEAFDVVAHGGVLVDIRPSEQRQPDGEIPGALIVGRNVLEWRLDPAAPSRLDEVDDSWYTRPVVVVCDQGYASSLAAEALQQLGLAGATDLVGGFQAWRDAGLPVAAAATR